jgi:CRP-like cAMP-binding protein
MHTFFAPLQKHKKHFTKFGSRVMYRKGEYLANAHDSNDWVFYLDGGLVSVGFVSGGAEDRLIGYFLPGMTFAQSGSFFETFSTLQLDYKACQNSHVLRLPRKDFLYAVHNNAGIGQDYVTGLLRNQIFLVERLAYQSEKGVYRKCVRWLLFMAKFYGLQAGSDIRIIPSITQEVVANFINTTRESVASPLLQLKRKKIISIERKQLTIHSLHLLEGELN